MNASWIKYLPSFIRTKLEGRHRLQAAASNAGWLLADKILRMAVNLVVVAWVARYLGPEQYGLISYALALVMILAGTLGSLGLKHIVIRDLVQAPESASLTLGTAFVLHLAAGLLVFVLSLLVIDVTNPGNDLARTIVAIIGFTSVFKASEPMRYWFESQVQSRYAVIADNVALFVMGAVRIGLILLHAPLVAFAWAFLAESAIISILLAYIYAIKVGGLQKWTARIVRARILLAESWPVILAAGASMINMRMDQFMLGIMVNNTVVGNYAAAVRLAEVWLFIPSIVGSSVYPSIIAAKEESETKYRKRINQITRLMATGVLPVAIFISIFSGQITDIVFGQQYVSAAKYLAICIWTGVPYMIFFVLSQMMYLEGLLKVGFWISIFTVMSNLLLNFILIPLYGGVGAAIATLATSIATMLITIIIVNLKTGIFFNKSKHLLL